MKYNKISADKIQLVKCPDDCSNIKLVLAEINSFYREAEEYFHAKEYQFSIFALKKAFAKTFNLKNKGEQECAKFFRLIITESLHNIIQELRTMTRSFHNQKYGATYHTAKETLEFFNMTAMGNGLNNMFSDFNASGDLISSAAAG